MTSPPAQSTAPLVDAQRFRDAMAQLAAPLAVVTTVDEDGRRWGFTASSVVSVSLDPPLLLVGLSRSSSCHRALVSSGEFVVNVLGEQHRAVAQRFATHGVDRFAGGGFTTWPGTDLPCLPDAPAVFRCVTGEALPAGDHDLLLGALRDTRIAPQASAAGTALLWYGRTFCAVPAPRP
ncbi:flavin reductase family protein [Streptomyces sp. NPDC005551]|uniref:flavin reductase family protein n=1 Tax=unclassified Streptomyces TaxID=2593676 RepID=UPI0033E2DDB0